MILTDSICRFRNPTVLSLTDSICRFRNPTVLSVGILSIFPVGIMSVSVKIVGISRYKKYGKLLPASIVTHTYNTLKYLHDTSNIPCYLHDTSKIHANSYQNIKGQHTYL